MRMPAKKFLERISRPVRSFLAPGGLVLGYHRISDSNWDPLNLAISRDNFREQLAVIADKCAIVSVRSMVESQRNNEMLKGHAAITFDDGCEDFIANAVPVLVNSDVPATIFVTTGYAGQRFWWDEVSNLLRPRDRMVNRLVIDFSGTVGRREFSNLTDHDTAANTVRLICDELLFLDADMRAPIIEQVREQIGLDSEPSGIPSALSAEQLAALRANPVLEVGAHSITHPVLTKLDENAQRREIQGSKALLDALDRKRPVTGFSYPNGAFSSQICELVRKSGFVYACTSRQGVVRHSTDSYRLPRIWPRNIGGAEFRRWFSTWSGSLN
jgi:peptidoglycan/xylan/chitin deacetylase (PgdA/CDA1 family)